MKCLWFENDSDLRTQPFLYEYFLGFHPSLLTHFVDENQFLFVDKVIVTIIVIIILSRFNFHYFGNWIFAASFSE